MKPTEGKTTKPSVLLVDDEPRVCAALAGVFVSEGYDVVFAESGDQALTKLSEHVFDIVLLDLRMPGKSGWETLSRLRRSRPELPVVIITALPGQLAQAQAAGAAALLEKPLEIPVLLETIQNILAEPGRRTHRPNLTEKGKV